MTALAVRELAVARGDRVLLRGLNFSVAPGEALHLHGPNGCGKTSLLEILCGLREAAAGEVSGLRDPERMHWIGHRNAVNPALSPEENLCFWCRVQGIADSGVPAALERLGLTKSRRKPGRLLSMGQRRRVALARLALARRPLWLLDEPLSSLDAHGVGTLVDLLRDHLAGRGAAIVTSHQTLPGDVPGLRLLELVR